MRVHSAISAAHDSDTSPRACACAITGWRRSCRIRRTSALAALRVTPVIAASHAAGLPYPSASWPRVAANRDSSCARAAASLALTRPSAARASPCAPAGSSAASGPLR